MRVKIIKAEFMSMIPSGERQREGVGKILEGYTGGLHCICNV